MKPWARPDFARSLLRRAIPVNGSVYVELCSDLFVRLRVTFLLHLIYLFPCRHLPLWWNKSQGVICKDRLG